MLGQRFVVLKVGQDLRHLFIHRAEDGDLDGVQEGGQHEFEGSAGGVSGQDGLVREDRDHGGDEHGYHGTGSQSAESRPRGPQGGWKVDLHLARARVLQHRPFEPGPGREVVGAPKHAPQVRRGRLLVAPRIHHHRVVAGAEDGDKRFRVHVLRGGRGWVEENCGRGDGGGHGEGREGNQEARQVGQKGKVKPHFLSEVLLDAPNWKLPRPVQRHPRFLQCLLHALVVQRKKRFAERVVALVGR
mmetsp:Transcript_5062/g.9633  ORF Transcript_5062/g.9633 Transcript_5062/m.9633 type:complete len:244 (-) Transcript_5062:723-1454(-)